MTRSCLTNFRITSYNVCYTKLLRYFHVFEAHLRLQRNENDFSAWIRGGLKLPELADRMKALNPYLGSLERLRSSLLTMCDDYLAKSAALSGAEVR